MNKEPQPGDRSDIFPPPSKELLRQIVLEIVNREDSTVIDVCKWGIVKYSPERFVVAEIFEAQRIFSKEMLQILPDSLLKLSAYNSEGEGSVESVTISGSSDDTVVGDIGEQAFDNMSLQAEDKFITNFFERNRINKLLELLALPSHKA
ncbi:hypothetical protein H7X69_02735 [Candidatus Saccharibacteria bacterium]|nr:hypothetical protein [Candidatus Saccharibacteria bacterium]